MAKVTIDFPEKSIFSTEIDVMITDLTGAMHVGNHVLVSYLTETQMRFLVALGFPELLVDGKLTMNTDLVVNYCAEVHYGDKLVVDVALGDIEEKGYDILFHITKNESTKNESTKKDSGKTVLRAKMGMVFIDLEIHRVCHVPPAFLIACSAAQ
jgi:acyl-CoA thioesterase FadM